MSNIIPPSPYHLYVLYITQLFYHTDDILEVFRLQIQCRLDHCGVMFLRLIISMYISNQERLIKRNILIKANVVHL